MVVRLIHKRLQCTRLFPIPHPFAVSGPVGTVAGLPGFGIVGVVDDARAAGDAAFENGVPVVSRGQPIRPPAKEAIEQGLIETRRVVGIVPVFDGFFVAFGQVEPVAAAQGVDSGVETAVGFWQWNCRAYCSQTSAGTMLPRL